MDDSYWPLSIAVFIALIIIEAVFYGFGAAIQNVNVMQLEKEAEEGNKRAKRLLSMVGSPTRFVYSIQIVTNLIGIMIGAWIFGVWRQRLDTILDGAQAVSAACLSVISVVLIGILTLVLLISFGILIPKRCAAKSPEKWAYGLVYIVTAVGTVLMPLIWVVTSVSWLLLKIVGIEFHVSDDNVTEEDIMSMVNEGHEQGVLEASEAEMITNIFELTDKDAGDVMTHRINLIAIDGDTTLADAVRFILKEGKNSRFPVYREDMDDIIGVLHMKDALICAERGECMKLPLSEIPGLLREAFFIPETRKLGSLFQEMQSQKIHMQIVVDEYGQTAGIVTMEDILEEIVGNILDEYDVDEEFVVISKDGYTMNGMTPLDDVADVLGIVFTEEDYDTYDTINGFLISRLDRIPQEDEDSEVVYEGYCFKIVHVENKMIRSISVTPIFAEPEEDERPQ